jgi:hypothetical protein
MQASIIIRDAVSSVAKLRQLTLDQPVLGRAIHEVKQFQAQRFTCSYRDLLASQHYGPAAQFFLEELYGDKDYSQRDEQFARIAGALERVFPAQVVETAVALAQLHLLTETLDFDMAEQWANSRESSDVQRYVHAWASVARRADRQMQLETVMKIGTELDKLTRTRGLRLMLKMMRQPAHLAGLSSLQHFLELGFDTFYAMGHGSRSENSLHFLNLVQAREAALLEMLFDRDTKTRIQQLSKLMNQHS